MKKKSLKLLGLFAFSAIMVSTILFLSCQKEETVLPETVNVPNEGITLKDGALHFETPEVFFKTTEALGKMSEMERDNWENNIGFKSLRSYINEVFSLISESSDDADVQPILIANSDILKIENDKISPIVVVSSYQAIINRDGIYYVQGVVHKVIANEVISS